MTTAGAFIQAAAALELGTLDQVTGGCALVLAPHPDDESLGCGGTIAEACQAGQPPVVVVLTDGSGSHRSPSYPPARLASVRETETLAAMACLGLAADRVVFLRVPDMEAPLEGPALHRVADTLVGIIRRFDCRALLATWQHDPHCDHLAAHRAACLAAPMARIPHRAFPIWGLTLPPDTVLDERAPRGRRLDIAAHLPAKRRAILSHRSQYAGLITDDPAGFQMQPGFMALFDGPTELFLDVT